MNTDKSKLRKDFTFSFPLRHSIVRNLKIMSEHVGDLEVSGTGYFNPYATHIDYKYQVDIDFVKWNGTDIRPVLEVLGAMDEIEIAAEVYLISIMDVKTEEVA